MDLWSYQIPVPFALAVVATLGYLFGRRRKSDDSELVARSRNEVRRAQAVANELEKIAWTVRKSLAKHHASMSKFKNRVGRLGQRQQDATWEDLCQEAEEILKPTLHLASQIARAYDEIRQQGANLMAFTETRTDPLTGLHNRRGLDDALAAQFAMMLRYESRFSLAIFDIDHFKEINDKHGHVRGDQMLRDLGKLFRDFARETDTAARFGGEEFVVIMPETDLEGACMFSDRLRARVEEQMPLSVSGGVTTVLDGDNQESLLSRADDALYQAKAAGRNCVFCHDGQQVESVVEEIPAATV